MKQFFVYSSNVLFYTPQQKKCIILYKYLELLNKKFNQKIF